MRCVEISEILFILEILPPVECEQSPLLRFLAKAAYPALTTPCCVALPMLIHVGASHTAVA